MDNANPDTAIVKKAATHVRGTIKPLVWDEITLDDGRKQWTTPAETITESHESWPPNQQGYFLFFTRKAYPTLEAAKSAAQADYEARILAQIDQAPDVQRLATECECCVDGLQADGETPCPCQDQRAEVSLWSEERLTDINHVKEVIARYSAALRALTEAGQ